MMIDFDYLWPKYNVNPDGVLHLGANTGQERFIYDKFGVKEVIWVEAIPSVFEELCKNIEPFENHTAVLACVGKDDGRVVVFNISNNEAQSSSYLELAHHKLIHPEVTWQSHFTTTIKRIDILFNEKSFKENNWFLNVDLQGAELDAFMGMGKMLDDFKWVYTEVNKKKTYDNCPLIEDIDYYLLQHGFERVETGQWVADTWTDALYCKI